MLVHIWSSNFYFCEDLFSLGASLVLSDAYLCVLTVLHYVAMLSHNTCVISIVYKQLASTTSTLFTRKSDPEKPPNNYLLVDNGYVKACVF